MIKNWNNFLNESNSDEFYNDIKDILIEYEDNSKILIALDKNNRVNIKVGRMYDFKGYSGKKELLKIMNEISSRLKSHGYSTVKDNIHSMTDPFDFDTCHHSYITIDNVKY